jgi:shikimate kinase
MGAGKTTIGRRLARHLGLAFIDLDHALMERTGADISLIFDIEGEAGFRKRESALLAELAKCERCIIATGGGVVLKPENRQVLSEQGFVVYLQVSVDRQLRRLAKDRQRPLLQTPDRRERLIRMAKERNPLYESVADLTIASDARHVGAMTRRVEQALREHTSLRDSALWDKPEETSS